MFATLKTIDQIRSETIADPQSLALCVKTLGPERTITSGMIYADGRVYVEGRVPPNAQMRAVIHQWLTDRYGVNGPLTFLRTRIEERMTYRKMRASVHTRVVLELDYSTYEVLTETEEVKTDHGYVPVEFVPTMSHPVPVQ